MGVPAINKPSWGDTARWSLGSLLAVGLHLGAALAVLAWNNNEATFPSPPPAAVMIELAALPAGPSVEPSEVPPKPKQEEAKPPPPEPESAPLPKQLKIPPPPESKAKPEVALPKSPPKPPPEQRRLPPQPVREKTPPLEPVSKPPAPAATTAPPAEQLPPAPRTEAPAPGASSAQLTNTVQTWQQLLLAHIERQKRYPSLARRRRQEGVTYLRFVMDREGQVLSARIERSSGYAILDEETMALIERAAPLPAPPPEVSGKQIELIVPVQFFIR